MWKLTNRRLLVSLMFSASCCVACTHQNNLTGTLTNQKNLKSPPLEQGGDFGSIFDNLTHAKTKGDFYIEDCRLTDELSPQNLKEITIKYPSGMLDIIGEAYKVYWRSAFLKSLENCFITNKESKTTTIQNTLTDTEAEYEDTKDLFQAILKDSRNQLGIQIYDRILAQRFLRRLKTAKRKEITKCSAEAKIFFSEFKRTKPDIHISQDLQNKSNKLIECLNEN